MVQRDRYARPAQSAAKKDGGFTAVNPETLPPELKGKFDAWIQARRDSFAFKTAFERDFCSRKKLNESTTKFGYKNDGLAFLPNASEGSKGAADFDEV